MSVQYRALLRTMTVWLIILALVPSSKSSAVEVEPFPLQPPDTSSPRATLESFMRNSADGIGAYRRGESAESMLPSFRRAERCLNLSEVSPDRVDSVATEAGLLIYEVLNRVGQPDYAEIPGEEEVERKELESWTMPGTEISLARVKEGEHKGEFLFSAKTLARAQEFYEKVKHLPHKTTYARGSYEEYVTRPDFSVPYLWADELPTWANKRFFRNPLWKWLMLLIALSGGVMAASLVYRLGRRWDESSKETGGTWRVGTLLFAVSLVVIPLVVERFLEGMIGIRFEVQAILSKSLFTVAAAATVFVLFALSEAVANAVILSQRFREKSVNAHLVRVIARILVIAASLVFIFEAAGYLGLALAPVLAGLGIGGLAVALAARPTLENILGGITLFADKPVRVGDFCRFGEQEGWVEEIGLRSTRIRRRDDSVVSIPNADFSQMQLQNDQRRRQRLYRTTLGLRYETTAEALRYLIAKLREMLLGHPKVSADRLSVRFVSFGDYSLDVEIFAYIATRDWFEYRAIREDINLRIMDIVKQAGTGFAFPSQTTYFARDGGLDAERGQRAEIQVENWRANAKLPFPEFEDAQRKRLEDSFDYPPQGSPHHKPRAAGSETAPEPGRSGGAPMRGNKTGTPPDD